MHVEGEKDGNHEQARLAAHHHDFPEIAGTEEIRVPANIAGSAANPDEGGRPVEETEDE